MTKGKNIEKLENKFKQYLRVDYACAFDSGRSALYAAIKSLELEKGSEILLQAYTCVVVPNAIIFNGLKPVYVDISSGTLNISTEDLENKITAKTKAVIIQNTFGIPAHYDKILALAKKYNLKIIEDCAHSLGVEFQGKKAGTMGDVAIFSFGRDKVISSVHGGMAVSDNKIFGQRLRLIQNSLNYPKKRVIFQHLMQPLVFALAKPVYNFFNLGKVLIVLSQKIKLISKVLSAEEKNSQIPPHHPAKFPNALAALALRQFKSLEKFNSHRRKLARFYEKNLQNHDFQLPVYDERNKNIFLRYTVQDFNKEKIMARAKAKGIYLGDWYDTVIAPKDVNFIKAGYEKGSCPAAEQVAERSFNLPTHPQMSLRKAKKIIEFLQNY